MTENQPTDALVRGLKKAMIHFSKAGFEVVSGVGDLVAGVVATVRNNDDASDSGSDVQRIDIE